MFMAWNTPSPPTPPGDWQEYSAGMDYRGWTLDCGKLFHVHITAKGGSFYTDFNAGALPVVKNLQVAQQAAEREIVRRVREMLPAYRAVFARLERRADNGKVTVLRPKD